MPWLFNLANKAWIIWKLLYLEIRRGSVVSLSRINDHYYYYYTSQGGFLKKRSTLRQVYYLMELNLIQVFLDLSAAYDMVDI
jgi:hypothetical protein